MLSSRLDSCNSLLYDHPDSLVHSLQLVQNSLARVVIPETNRNYHITPVLKKLHWLPIKQRVTYKIALLTYKIFAIKQPSYLFDLMTPLPHLVDVHRHKNVLSHTLSNHSLVDDHSSTLLLLSGTLPNSIRCSNSLDNFRSSLKPYLFPP